MKTGIVTSKLYNPFSEFDSVKKIWVSLLKRCPHSYYMSWGWIELWLKSLSADCELFLVVGYVDKEFPVIAFFLGLKEHIQNRFFKFQRVALNQTLIPHIDVATYIEYNSVLIDPEIKISLEALLKLILIKSWDEFHMVRSASIYQPNLILDNMPGKKYEIDIKSEESHYVDLEKIRRNNNDYLGLLSQNRRQQIRRSIKEYEKMGEIQVHVSCTKEESLKFFDEFVDLHQKRWTERGYPGAMSSEYTVNYHKNVISRRFEHNEIQLMKMTVGDHTLGCLYHFVYDGVVYFNLSGFNYLPGNVYRPGLVCHYYAIMYNVEHGLNRYDFMAGEHEYKPSLSTDYNEMQTIQVKRKNIKFYMNRVARKLYQMYGKDRKARFF